MKKFRRSVFVPARGRRMAWPAALVAVVAVLGIMAPPAHASSLANEAFTVYQGLSALPSVPTSIVVVQPYKAELTATQIHSIHAKKPGARVLRYVDTTEAINTVSSFSDPQSWSLAYARRLNTDTEWRTIWASHQSWFLKDAQGQYIHRSSSNAFEMNPRRAYLMDQGSAGWREWLAGKVGRRLSYGYDGVFLDLCSPTPRGYSAMPAKYANDYSLWRCDVNGLINYIKSKYPSAVVITNSIWQGQSYYASCSPNPIDANKQNGTEIEGFVYGKGTGPLESEADWLKEVKIVKRIGDQGKIVLARTTVAYNDSGSPKRLLAYSLATFLLGKSNSKGYFNFISWKGESGYSTTYLKAVYALPLGSPLNVYYQKGVAYRRDFANGKVIVNPNDSGQSYTFQPLPGNRYKDQDGHVYDADHPLKLPPKTGVILIALPSSTPPAGATRYEQSYARILKSGTWETFTKPDASGGTYGRSATEGASATITFNGTKLNVIAMKGTTTGIVDVYLDGFLKAKIDTAASEASYQRVLWSTGTLASGTHTVKLVRDRNTAAGKFLTLDAVDVWGRI